MPSTKTLKARLEESIVWVSIGVFSAGLLLGLALAKDSVFARMTAKAELAAASPGSSSSTTPNVELKSIPALSQKSSVTYRQVDSTGGQPNCATCTIAIFKIAQDVIVFSTNNGLIGSAHFDKSSASWKGHAQFSEGNEYWKKVLIFVEMEISTASVKAKLKPTEGSPWGVRYAK